jgi:hypothetical protein
MEEKQDTQPCGLVQTQYSDLQSPQQPPHLLAVHDRVLNQSEV